MARIKKQDRRATSDPKTRGRSSNSGSRGSNSTRAGRMRHPTNPDAPFPPDDLPEERFPGEGPADEEDADPLD